MAKVFYVTSKDEDRTSTGVDVAWDGEVLGSFPSRDLARVFQLAIHAHRTAV